MGKNFCNRKFRYLLILSDTIVIGSILGEQALAAVNGPIIPSRFSFLLWSQRAATGICFDWRKNQKAHIVGVEKIPSKK